MTREVPTGKPITAWRGAGRWFQRRADAYYAIAKQLVVARYPRWLQDADLEEIEPSVEDVATIKRGDLMAQCEPVPMPDWRARRDKAERLFFRDYGNGWTDEGVHGSHFDPEKWQRFVRRVARYLAFVDKRRAT